MQLGDLPLGIPAKDPMSKPTNVSCSQVLGQHFALAKVVSLGDRYILVT